MCGKTDGFELLNLELLGAIWIKTIEVWSTIFKFLNVFFTPHREWVGVLVSVCLCVWVMHSCLNALVHLMERVNKDVVFCWFDHSSMPISAVPGWSNCHSPACLARTVLANWEGQFEADLRVFPPSRAQIKKCRF